jgi:Tfp pilus assembly protein PilN
MPELEFLPSWYPQARRRRRLFHLQAWSFLAVIGALCLWLSLVHRNVRAAELALRGADTELAQSRLELTQLQEQLRLKGELEYQRQIVSRLGTSVEMSRLLRALDSVMPKEMSLVELNVETDEQPVRPAGQRQSSTAAPEVDRRLNVRLVGVAPSDVDLANFLTGLTGVRFFENVSMTYSRDKAQGGHVLREFEVTFSLNLNRPAIGG